MSETQYRVVVCTDAEEHIFIFDARPVIQELPLINAVMVNDDVKRVVVFGNAAAVVVEPVVR